MEFWWYYSTTGGNMGGKTRNPHNSVSFRGINIKKGYLSSWSSPLHFISLDFCEIVVGTGTLWHFDFLTGFENHYYRYYFYGTTVVGGLWKWDKGKGLRERLTLKN